MRTFGSYHPVVLMLYFASVIITAMFTSNPIMSVITLCGAVLFCTTISGAREAWKLMRIYLPMLLIFSLTNPFFSHNGATTLFYVGDNSITLEALLYGVSAGVTIISVMLWCNAYMETVTSDKFLYVFGKITPKISLVLSTTLRFVPLFIRQAKRVGAAQKTMGLYVSDKRFAKARGAMRVMSALITWSLEYAMDTADSMKARGYGLKGRSSYSLFRFTHSDSILLSMCIVLTGTMITCSVLGAGKFTFYPIIVAPSPCVTLYLLYASCTVLAFLPYIIELKEKAEWKYCVLKI